MGRRGPTPKPDKLKALEGNPGKRRLNLKRKEPGGLPTCPSELSPQAKNEWKRVSKELHAVGLLSVVDRAALAVYCDTYVKWISATAQIDVQGMTMEYTNTEGETNTVPRPEVAIAQKYAGIIKSFCAEFGLTPSSRCRMVLPNEKPKKDEFEDDFG